MEQADRPVSQTVYAGPVVYGKKNRRDSVEYCDENGIVRKGTIQAIFANNTIVSRKIAYIRRMESAPFDPGNENVSIVYGNSRLQYCIGQHGDCVLDIFPVSHLKRIIIIVPDLYDVSRRHGIFQRVANIPDTKEERLLSRFFEVSDYQVTSFPERKCE